MVNYATVSASLLIKAMLWRQSLLTKQWASRFHYKMFNNNPQFIKQGPAT